MKIVAISDTHGKHQNLILPEGDMLIHAGDVSSLGKESEIKDFLNWFSQTDFKHKILIAGNHDFYFEKIAFNETIVNQLIPSNIIYLNDCGVEIEGIQLWGSPIQPWFYNWAFNRYRGEDIKKHWNKIPHDVDILITHGPAYGILDKTTRNENVGCEDLLVKIKQVKPKFHICGHIHEAYGRTKQSNTEFINASVLDQNYNLRNRPVAFEI
ncbi:MAG: metallophosphatase domain-containing protein [Emticicia sp.]|nr:metallophosphatase domain-containing protein [Emticicia sp.]